MPILYIYSEGYSELRCLFTCCSSGINKLLFLWLQCTDVEKRRLQSCIHFMNLKKLNRLAHMRLKKGRDQTHDVMPADSLPRYVPWHRRLRRFHNLWLFGTFRRSKRWMCYIFSCRTCSTRSCTCRRRSASVWSSSQYSHLFTVLSHVCFILFFITARN